MRKIILTFGIIAGVVMTGIMFATMPLWGNELDYGSSEFLGYLSMIIALAPTIFIGVKSVRDKEQSGKISFGSAFKVGLLITLVTYVIYVAGWVTYLNTTDNDFMEGYTTYTIEQLEKAVEVQEVVDAKREEMVAFAKMYENPFVQIGFSFLEVVPVGLLISLLVAGILVKK